MRRRKEKAIAKAEGGGNRGTVAPEAVEHFWKNWRNNLTVPNYAVGATLTRSYQKGRLDHWQMVTVHEGALVLEYFANRATILTDQALIVPPSHPFRMGPTESAGKSAFSIVGFDVFPSLPFRNPLACLEFPFPVSVAAQPQFRDNIGRLQALCSVNGRPPSESARAEAKLPLDVVLNLWLCKAFGSGIRLRGDPIPEWLRKFADQLFATAMRPKFCLSESIAASGYSRAHLYRLFSYHFGVTPDAYARESRMRLAVKFLSGEPTMPIGTVAMSCGYTNQTLFNRHFKSQFGMAPGKFRSE
jgi:AraC-like DNA-binding protein